MKGIEKKPFTSNAIKFYWMYFAQFLLEFLFGYIETTRI